MWARLAFAMCTLCATHAAAQDEFQYRDRRGGPVVSLPYGAESFADEVVAYIAGDPPPQPGHATPSEAIGPPGGRRFVSLGCGGVLVLRFTNNVLIDVPGPDLYVFETGPAREATSLAISDNGVDWINVGRIGGATAEVDISSHAAGGVRYTHVRLTDLRESCGAGTPGADIDAVAAIGAGPLQTLDSVGDSLFFNVDRAELRPEAASTLDALAIEIDRRNPVLVFVVGHTDSDGTDTYNLGLSNRRAQEVRDALASRRPGVEIISSGYGETYPIAENDTEEHRAQNRRVEVLIVPR